MSSGSNIMVYWIESSYRDIGDAVWLNNETSTNVSERVLDDIQKAYSSVSFITHVLIITWDPGSCRNRWNDEV